MDDDLWKPGPIPVKAAAFDDFLLTDHLPAAQAPAVIERDREYMAARPGFNRKLLPLRVEEDTGNVYSGGRYLFDSWENACEFGRWLSEDFELDGTLILERPDFADVTTHLWKVIGAYDFKPVDEAQHIYRTEIFSLEIALDDLQCESMWESVFARARDRDAASVWLLRSEDRKELSLVTVVAADPARSHEQPDFTGIKNLETSASLLAPESLTSVFDRTHWVFTIWYPRVNGEDVRAADWPNSPPLPRP